MKLRLVVLAMLAATAAIGQPAQAQNYPWCAHNTKDGGFNCAFTTFHQCLADISGIGGFCEQNNTYQPPADGAPRRRHKPS